MPLAVSEKQKLWWLFKSHPLAVCRYRLKCFLPMCPQGPLSCWFTNYPCATDCWLPGSGVFTQSEALSAEMVGKQAGQWPPRTRVAHPCSIWWYLKRLPRWLTTLLSYMLAEHDYSFCQSSPCFSEESRYVVSSVDAIQSGWSVLHVSHCAKGHIF